MLVITAPGALLVPTFAGRSGVRGRQGGSGLLLLGQTGWAKN